MLGQRAHAVAAAGLLLVWATPLSRSLTPTQQLIDERVGRMLMITDDDRHACRTELTLAKAKDRITVLFARSDSSSAALVWTGELFTSSASLAWPNEIMLRRHDDVSSRHVQSTCLMLHVQGAEHPSPSGRAQTTFAPWAVRTASSIAQPCVQNRR